MKNSVVFLLLFSITMCLSVHAPAQTKVNEVIVVFKTHFDIGYTDWADNVVYNYSHSTITGALDLIEKSKQYPKNEQFKWTISGWPMQKMISLSEPAVKPRIEKAIREGDLIVQSMPLSFETEALDLEPLVRSLSYSSKINREAGLSLPIDAKQTDVPSHSWILPTILTNAGIKFLHIGCNAASMSPDVPMLFWWEGPDKSRVMTMYYGPYYGTSPAPPQGWPFKSWLAIVMTNDNTGVPSFQDYRNAIEEIQKLNPGAKIKTGSMGDFYASLIKENPELPVIRGDMPDTWIHGYMSMPKEVKEGRILSKSVANLEALNSLTSIWGCETEKKIGPVVDDAMEQIHLWDEHSFGMAMSHGHGGYWAYGDEFDNLRSKGFYDPIEYSWKEKASHIDLAAKLINPALTREMKGLAESIDIKGDRIVVYNPLPWERSGLVTVQTTSKLSESLKNTMTGEVVPVFRNHNILQFKANKIPSMGYVSFVPTENTKLKNSDGMVCDAKGGILENQFFKVVFDLQNGTIKSVKDKNSGRELVNPDSELQFGQYVYERFSKQNTDKYARDYIKGGYDWAYPELGRINLTNEPYTRSSGKNARVEFLNDSISVSAVMHFNSDAALKQNYSLICTLTQTSPVIEIIWSIKGKPADAWPEGGWVSFPFNVEKPVFKLGRPGAVVDPAIDYIKGSNHDYCFLSSGMAILDSNNQGFGIMSPDVPGISLDRPGLWSYSPDFVPKKANVFFNLFNNQWSTNFTEWIEGSWNARFYIWSIDKYAEAASIVTPSEEIRNPLMTGLATGNAGKMPAFRQGIVLSAKGVLVTAFGKNRDGSGDLLRLWEQNGINTKCVVTLPVESKYSVAQSCNLRGEKNGMAIQIKDHSFVTELNACQPVTFILN